MTWDVALGFLTGLRLLNPGMEAMVLLRTAIIVHICDAIMCRLIAHNNGYRKNLWTLLGFVFGIWALGLLILLPKRKGQAGARELETAADDGRDRSSG